jgi:hypothetical protein
MPGYTGQSWVGAGENHSEFPKNSLQLEAGVVAKAAENFVEPGPHNDKSDVSNIGQSAIWGCNEVKYVWQERRGTKEINSHREQTVEYVPIQIINVSLEEVELTKHTYVGPLHTYVVKFGKIYRSIVLIRYTRKKGTKEILTLLKNI